MVPGVEGSNPFVRPFFCGGEILSVLQAFFLGIIQGITEFLPVSSSGHLEIAQYILGLENLDQYITFDLVCHLGTLCAIFVVYATQIKKLFTNDYTRLKQVIIGTLPLFPILLILKPVESLYNKPHLLGLFFLTTAALLYTGIRWGYEKPASDKKKSWWQDAIIIGTFQTIALLPGVSRSGSTISGARLLGWEKQDAVTFSFLLAIPAILGGATLKLFQLTLLGETQQGSLDLIHYVVGFATAFFIGYLALLLLIRLASKEKFMYFVWYCLLLGLATSFYFYVKL